MKYVTKSVLIDPKRHLATRDVLLLATESDVQKAAEAQAFLKSIEEFEAERTRLTHDRVIDTWVDFAKARQADPWVGDPQVVAAWFFFSRRRRTKRTIQERATILRSAFVRRGLPDPTRTKFVAETLDALMAKAPKRGSQTYDVLLVDDFRKLKRAASAASSLSSLRSRVFLGLGFVGILRPEPILGLLGSDVSISGDTMTLHSKYRGNWLIQRISSSESDGLVEDMRDYLNLAEIQGGPIFPALEHNRVLDYDHVLHKSRFHAIFKEVLVLAGYDPKCYCWSSLRYGYLYSGHLRGVDKAALARRAGLATVAQYSIMIKKINDGSGTFRLADPSSRRQTPLSLVTQLERNDAL